MKRIAYLVLALICLMLCAVPAMAEGGQVIYSGNAGEFVFNPGSEDSLTDLFPAFKDVMPGDTLEQTILVRNDADKNVKVDIYLRALGAQAGSEDFLSQLQLTVKKADDTVMFKAAANETAQLTDWYFLGTLYSGGQCELIVTLEVPTSLGNEFEDAKGYLDWEFMINELPVEPDDPTPDTGDDFEAWPFIILMVLSAAGIAVLLLAKKRSK